MFSNRIALTVMVILLMISLPAIAFDPMPGAAMAKEAPEMVDEVPDDTLGLDEGIEEDVPTALVDVEQQASGAAQEVVKADSEADIEALGVESVTQATQAVKEHEVSAEATAGEISAMMRENYRLDQLIELYRKRAELHELMSTGTGQQASWDDTSWLSEPSGSRSAEVLVGVGKATLPEQQRSTGTLPLISRISGSNGRLSANLIYRNGDIIPDAEAGTVLPTGQHVVRVAMDEVVIVTKGGEEQRLHFVPRYLAR